MDMNNILVTRQALVDVANIARELLEDLARHPIRAQVLAGGQRAAHRVGRMLHYVGSLVAFVIYEANDISVHLDNLVVLFYYGIDRHFDIIPNAYRDLVIKITQFIVLFYYTVVVFYAVDMAFKMIAILLGEFANCVMAMVFG